MPALEFQNPTFTAENHVSQGLSQRQIHKAQDTCFWEKIALALCAYEMTCQYDEDEVELKCMMISWEIWRDKRIMFQPVEAGVNRRKFPEIGNDQVDTHAMPH